MNIPTLHDYQLQQKLNDCQTATLQPSDLPASVHGSLMKHALSTTQTAETCPMESTLGEDGKTQPSLQFAEMREQWMDIYVAQTFSVSGRYSGKKDVVVRADGWYLGLMEGKDQNARVSLMGDTQMNCKGVLTTMCAEEGCSEDSSDVPLEPSSTLKPDSAVTHL